jgi:hypothetical protein
MHYVIDGVIVEISKTENFSSGFKIKLIVNL